jgi:hypothetical protein
MKFFYLFWAFPAYLFYLLIDDIKHNLGNADSGVNMCGSLNINTVLYPIITLTHFSLWIGLLVTLKLFGFEFKRNFFHSVWAFLATLLIILFVQRFCSHLRENNFLF